MDTRSLLQGMHGKNIPITLTVIDCISIVYTNVWHSFSSFTQKTLKTFMKLEFAIIHLCKDIDEKVFAKLVKVLENFDT